MNETVGKIFAEIKSILVIILIALSLRATVIEAYIVPTGSMENTIMTGDFLIGNKFVYGMRTPDWIGIPYTEIGFEVPWVRFPEFKKTRQGDVVIFKYPRDEFQKYVKRCIAEPGQTVEIRDKKVFVDGVELPLASGGKFVDLTAMQSGKRQPGIFLRNNGNRDNIGPIYVPKKGDVFPLSGKTDWDYLLPIMLMDGHRITAVVNSPGRVYEFTMKDPDDIARRYISGLGYRLRRLFLDAPIQRQKINRLFKKYYGRDNQRGRLLNVWNVKFDEDTIERLLIDGQPIRNLTSYTVEQDYYWMMGDNRDDSADSRYWGFVPHKLVLGEAVFVYMSWDSKNRGPRFGRIGKVIS